MIYKFINVLIEAIEIYFLFLQNLGLGMSWGLRYFIYLSEDRSKT
jgi:hypothetical protein